MKGGTRAPVKVGALEDGRSCVREFRDPWVCSPKPPAGAVSTRGRRLALGAGAALALLVSGCGGESPAGLEAASPARQGEVAIRGRGVMPFDLERTTHAFRELPHGGTQTVVARDPSDIRQAALVQAHLRQEAAKFRRGDFADPAAIHGDDMPGLAELRAARGRIGVRYEPVPDGARLHYSARDPKLIAGLHSWFRAQVADHGRHADHR